MMEETSFVVLSWWHVLASMLFLLIIGIAICWLKLDLGGPLVFGAIRCFLQLTAVGYILEWAFNTDHPIKLAFIVVIMAGIAAHTAYTRQGWQARGLKLRIFAALILSVTLSMLPLLTLILDLKPWYHPYYSIPLAGMVLANSMNGIMLFLDRFRSEMSGYIGEFEAYLSLGATTWLAALPMIRRSVRAGLMPALNQLAVMGVVALPGMMSGQIIAGVSPIEAVKYQIIVMYLLTSAIAMSILLMVLQSTWLIVTAKLSSYPEKEQFEKLAASNKPKKNRTKI
ncbi:iron export ABC transporter permease subunit FetB [bacterium]|nr:iron export ABC transporter permease subunit FetB [bacterium]